MERNVAGQRFFVAAIDPTGDRVTGEAANITAVLSKDGGAPAATNDVNPAELGTTGVYLFDATQTETDAAELVLAATCSTADVHMVSLPGAIYTRPTLFSNLAYALRAMPVAKVSAATDASNFSVTKLDDTQLSTASLAGRSLTFLWASGYTPDGQARVIDAHTPATGAMTVTGADGSAFPLAGLPSVGDICVIQ